MPPVSSTSIDTSDFSLTHDSHLKSVSPYIFSWMYLAGESIAVAKRLSRGSVSNPATSKLAGHVNHNHPALPRA